MKKVIIFILGWTVTILFVFGIYNLFTSKDNCHWFADDEMYDPNCGWEWEY